MIGNCRYKMAKEGCFAWYPPGYSNRSNSGPFLRLYGGQTGPAFCEHGLRRQPSAWARRRQVNLGGLHTSLLDAENFDRTQFHDPKCMGARRHGRIFATPISLKGSAMSAFRGYAAAKDR